MISDDGWKRWLDIELELHRLGNRAPRRVRRELADVYLRRRTFRQSPELREARRHSLEPLRLGLQNLNRIAEVIGGVALQLFDREADGSERILQLVGNLSRALAKCLESLRLNCLAAPLFDFRRHRAHALPQLLELGRSADAARHYRRVRSVAHDHRRSGWRQWLAMTEQIGPPDELVERPAQLPAEVTGHS